MFKFNSVVTRLSIACVLLVSAPAALAQDILVVDATKVLQDSKAGKDVAQKVQQIGATMQSELLPEQNNLKTEKEALDAKVRGKTREQVGQDAALVQQLESYARKLQMNAAKTEKRSQELARTENNALYSFREKMSEAVEKVRARKNGKIVLMKAMVYSNVDAVEITQEVIQQLDQDTPSIVVERVTLPDAPAQQ